MNRLYPELYIKNLNKMKSNILKIIIFILIIIAIIILNMYIFRSDVPMLWFITLIGSVVAFLYFPYNKFFKIK